MATDDVRLAPLADIPGLAGIGEHERLMLLRFANEMAGFYQSPVYLCGSALKKSDPRDIDIRIQLDDDDFKARYGGTPAQWIEEGHTGAWTRVRWRWSSDCTKRTKHAWLLTSNSVNVDFQVYPMAYCLMRFANEPRVRLDEMTA